MKTLKTILAALVILFMNYSYGQEPISATSGSETWDIETYNRYEKKVERRQNAIRAIGWVVIAGINATPFMIKTSREFIVHKAGKAWNAVKEGAKGTKEKVQLLKYKVKGDHYYNKCAKAKDEIEQLNGKNVDPAIMTQKVKSYNELQKKSYDYHIKYLELDRKINKY